MGLDNMQAEGICLTRAEKDPWQGSGSQKTKRLGRNRRDFTIKTQPKKRERIEAFFQTQGIPFSRGKRYHEDGFKGGE